MLIFGESLAHEHRVYELRLRQQGKHWEVAITNNDNEILTTVHNIHTPYNIHDPLRWVGRVPMGQKSFLTHQP